MKSLRFDFGLISRYRIQLMGLAAIMIIACHAPKHGVEMPPILASTLVLGNLGVDLFLFLSGMGLWFSLSKSRLTVSNLKNWYAKRYKRLLIPYCIVMIPFWGIVTYMNNEGIGDFLIHTSTVGFWLWHEGAWFVAMLIPLYLITPPHLFDYKQIKQFICVVDSSCGNIINASGFHVKRF